MKQRITSADISGPTQSPGSSVQNVKTIPIRQLSTSSQLSSGFTSGKSKDISSPEKVIKALYNYQAQSAGELSFNKGDFFHVQQEENDWYEASNPADGKRGMVPKNYFEIFGRTRPNSHASPVKSINRNGSVGSNQLLQHHQQQQQQQQQQQPSNMGTLYAIVLYDFQAEKADELTAYAGENLFICAHHDFEWFIAKPIGRLGGPGLVPVGFVTIIDIATGYATGNDVKSDIESVNLPSVQEWKINIARYKASNITLGSVEQQGQSYVQHRSQSRQNSQNRQPHPSTQHSSAANTTYPADAVVLTYAAVETFFLQDDKYWFQVSCQLSNNTTRILKRYYEDFYDLQVKLLDIFPAEGGKLRDTNGQWTKRIMPYIPGPVPYVTDTISKKRKDDLNIYVKDLISLPPHISQSHLVKGLFAVKNNGFDREISNDETVELDVKGRADDSTLTNQELQLPEAMKRLSLINSASNASAKVKSRPPSGFAPRITDEKPVKIKFYYKDDIFALMLHPTITFEELCSKIAPRIDADSFKLYIKNGDDIGTQVTTDAEVPVLIQEKRKIFVDDS